MLVHSSRAPLLAALQQDKAPTKISPENPNYTDVFSFDMAIELPGNTGINEHAIKVIERNQSPDGPIYSPNRTELEILMTYIETYLKTRCICLSKSLAGAPIHLNKKLNDSSRSCVNYRSLNNLNIKN